MGESPVGARPSKTTSDRASFHDFYDEHYLPVLKLAYVLTGRWQIAEEIAQEAFVSAYRRWDAVRDFDRPDSWIRTVAANRARSGLRRVAAEARAIARLSRRRGTNPGESRDDDFAHHDERFWAAVRALPRRQREAVALYYLEDRSVADVAGTMGVTEGTAKRHLYDARRSLAETLQAEGWEEAR